MYLIENFSGSFDFRCREHTDYKMSANIHEYSEILFVRRGAARVTIDTRELVVPEKSLIFIPPNSLHAYDCTGECVCAVFSRDFIPLFFKATGGKVPVPTPIDVSDMADVVDTLPAHHNKGSCTVAGSLNLICAKVIEKSTFCDIKSPDILLFQKITSHISNHYTEDITLKGLAREFGYNEKYLSSTLHSLCKMNFRTLLASYRINCAKALINNNKDMSMTEVCTRCGFSDVSTFNRAFLALEKMTPTEYKKGQT